MWKEFDVETFNKKQQEMGIEKTFPSKCFVNMQFVCAFYDNTDENNIPLVTLIFQGGESISIYATFESVKEIMMNVNPRGFHANS